MNLGTYLRQAREARNLTTEDIATRTKISVRLLRNLEANDFNHWPQPDVYRIGFLRAYARAVGLDPSDVVARFLSEFSDRPEPRGTSTRESRAPRHVLPVLLTIAAIVVPLSILLTRRDNGPQEPDAGAALLAQSEPRPGGRRADIPLEPEAGGQTSRIVSSGDPSVIAEGELEIVSSPAGALVTVNGIGRGKTPITVRYLPLGSHAVRVVHPGYASQERQVTLTAEQSARRVSLTLRPILSDTERPNEESR
jgi:transcriptional regulator with XRE-family HTH domain